MSVINKMLRDLDRRANPLAAAPATASALRQGTASVSVDTLAAPTGAGSSARLWLALGLLTVVGAAVGAWWWQTTASDTARTAAPAAAVAPVAAAVAPMPAAAPAAVASASSATASAAAGTSADAVPEQSVASMILRMEPSLSARKALDALLSAPAPAVASNPPNPVPRAAPLPTPPAPPATAATATSASAALPQERPTASPRTAASRPAASATANPGGESTPILQRQQQAGGDALAQALTLWNSGSRDAAMELMQQSIAAAERSAKAGAPGTTGPATLLPLVREMARMQLAEARFGAVWEMLTRLEPLLGNPPDLWAIRANAAQRLGRHQDSVHAYMMALQSRPDEQRWLLGTAVSLAALGQTSSAAEMAEKARAAGPVSKEILAYLRQAGVPLREP